MTGTLYLFAAFSITWLIIFLYIFSISRRQKTLEREIEKISKVLGERS
ncbi:MAG: CcmD family protein [Thermodesulfobacteriota bacterium]